MMRGFAPSRTHILAALLAIELVVLGFLVPGYLAPGNLIETTRTFVESGMLALGMTFVIVSGGIDLSVAALLALASVAIGQAHAAGLPMASAAMTGVAVGTAGGALNGVVIARLGLHPFVVTLATMAIFRGAAYAVSGGSAVSNFPAGFTVIGQGHFAGGLIPAQLPILVVAAIACWLMLDRGVFGRRVIGIGANELAARFSGVHVDRVKVRVYALMGLLAGVAAVVQTARISTARANAALGLELPVIAMVVLGGTRITGGRGTIGGTLLGVAVLAYLQDGLVALGVPGDWGLVVVGLFLIGAVATNTAFTREPRA